MKRVLALLLALVMALSLVSVVYAEPCAEDAHQWGDVDVQTPATCGVDGVMNTKCSVCQAPSTRTIPATGAHTYVQDEEKTNVAGDCTTDKVDYLKCSGCGATKESITTAPGHSYTTTSTATCNTAGKETSVCSVCKHTIEKDAPATGQHTFNEADVGTVKTAATCLDKGVKTITCTVCKTATKVVEVPALGHKFSTNPDDAEITKEATCVEEGERTYKCLNKKADGTACPETKKEPIEKLKEHKWEKNGTVTTAPTCVKKGVRTFKCTVEKCTETKTEEIAMVNHSWDNGTTTIEATVTEEGLSTFKCIVCGKTQTQTIPRLGESMDPDELATLKAAPNNAYGAKLNVEPWVMVQAVLDQEELTRVQGGWPFSVTLGVKNISSQVSDGDRQLFMNHIADEQIIVAFLDVTLIKQMHGDPAQPVDATAEMVDIALDMPEGLPALKKNMTRSFMVLRLHNGVVEGVPTKLSEDGRQIIFQTDKFSTYLLTYSDVRKESGFPILPVFIALMVVALAGVVYLCKMIFIDRIFDGDDDDDDDDYDEYDEYEEPKRSPKQAPKQSGRRLHTEKRRRR